MPSTVSTARNPGMPLDLRWLEEIAVNPSAVVRRCDSLTKRRSVKKESQAAWLLRAIECIDLTTLAGDDTPGYVQRLCAKARHPLRFDLAEALTTRQFPAAELKVAAVCVYHALVAPAVEALRG